MRKELIRTILEIAGDECESVKDMEVLAAETEEELINRVMNIAYNLSNELNTL